MLFIYNLLMVLALIVCWPFILFAVCFLPKRRQTVLQRLGLKRLPPMRRPEDGRPIWVHALSVGEVLSAIPLVGALKKHFKGRPIIFSATTLTGFGIAENQLTHLVDGLGLFPYDLPISVRRVAGRINPALVVLVETDIWPNFLAIMQKRNVPVALVNARLSDRSFNGYRRLGPFARTVFSMLAAVGVQTATDAKRFQQLGVRDDKISLTGSLKFDQKPATDHTPKIANLKSAMEKTGRQPIFLAGSIHKGEEAILARMLLRIKKSFPGTGMMVVPRDPAEGHLVAKYFKEIGFQTVLMSELTGFKLPPDWDVIVVAAMGVLRELYSLCEVAFVGGSMVACGGHNPLEPAALKKPVLFGPDMGDFRAAAEPLIAAGGAYQVKDEKEFLEKTELLFKDAKQRDKMGAKAFEVFNANQGSVAKTVTQLAGLLEGSDRKKSNV